MVMSADQRECLCSSTLCSTISRGRTCLEPCSPSNSLATLSWLATSFSSCSELFRLPLLSNLSATSTSTLKWTKRNSYDDIQSFGCVKLVAEVKLAALGDGDKLRIVNRYAICFLPHNADRQCGDYSLLFMVCLSLFVCLQDFL